MVCVDVSIVVFFVEEVSSGELIVVFKLNCRTVGNGVVSSRAKPSELVEIDFVDVETTRVDVFMLLVVVVVVQVVVIGSWLLRVFIST